VYEESVRCRAAEIPANRYVALREPTLPTGSSPSQGLAPHDDMLAEFPRLGLPKPLVMCL